MLSLAIDDTDSQYGGCTTHLTGLILAELRGKAKLADYPLLVRLNPNIPWRTRGNAATVLRLEYDGDPKDLLELAWQMASEYVSPRPPLPGKSPGVVVVEGEPWRSEELRWLYRQALGDVVTIDVARRALDAAGALYVGGRGLIGAASALAALAPGDPYTFELTFYRRPENWGVDRCVDFSKALAIDGSTSASINNIDLENGVVSAAPGGPDPVLAGFRGLDPGELWSFEEALCERPHFAVLYRSNQHTGVHAQEAYPLPYRSVRIRGRVASPPRKLPGGHVVVRLEAGAGEVDVAFYRETGPLARAAELLQAGDEVEVVGGVRPYRSPDGRPVVAAESLTVLSLADSAVSAAPRCPRCGARMESAGSGKGYRCPRCGLRLPPGSRLVLTRPRRLVPSTYAVGYGRLRHLSPVPGVAPPVLERLPAGLEVADVLRIY